MGDYNFWQDLFDTYQSLPDWMKFAWLVVPPTFVLAILAIALRTKPTPRKPEIDTPGDLVYSVYHDKEGRLHIVGHKAFIDTQQTPILFVPPAAGSETLQIPKLSK